MPPSARSTFTVILAAAFSAATSASGGGRAAFENRQRAIADGLARGLREIPVRARYRRHPTARRSRSRRWLSGNARSRAGFRPARSNRALGASWRNATRAVPRRHDGDVARRLGQRHQRDAAPVAVGIGDQFVGGLDPGVPARRGAPAVVEQDHQRRAGAGNAGLRIPDRSGGGQDHQRRGRAGATRSATTACATGFLPSARCRTTAASAETRCAAAAAASPATATTAPAG